MKRLQINIHSFTDAISNSSSETFIATGNHTISTIKEIIEQLVDIYNAESNLYNTQNKDQEHFWPRQIIDKSKLWTDIFREPEIAEFEITIPEKVKELDKYYSTRNSYYFNCNFDNWIANTKFNYSELEEKVSSELKGFSAKLPPAPYPDRKLEETDKKLYKQQYEAYLKNSEKIMKFRTELEKKYFKDWYKYCEEQMIEMWKLNCKLNDINFEDLGSYSFSYWSENVHMRFNRELRQENNPLPEKLQRFVDEVSMCDSYKFDIQKGSIIINSASDNSIPYDLMEKVVEILGAKRYHLG